MIGVSLLYACSSMPSRCAFPKGIGYVEFEPSKATVEDIIRNSPLVTRTNIRRSKVVWAKLGESEVAACIVNNDLSLGSCGAITTFFYRTPDGWMEAESEVLQCDDVIN